MLYSNEHRDWENIDKNISKMLSGKYSQKPFDHAKLFVTNALTTTSKRRLKKLKN